MESGKNKKELEAVAYFMYLFTGNTIICDEYFIPYAEIIECQDDYIVFNLN